MVKLNAVTAGTTLKFGNKNWILLNPQTGFLLCTEGGNVGFEDGLSSFSFSHPNVQGWFSNIYNGFYKKKLVEAKSYNVGGYGGSYDVVMSPPQYIGTISAFDFYQYQSMLGTAVSNAWTTSFGVGGILKTNGSSVSVGNNTGATAWYYLYPTIYITPTTEVTNGEITGNTAPTYTQIPAQTTKKDVPITLNLNNYFTDIDNDVLSYTATSVNTNIATVAVSGNVLTITGQAIGIAVISVTASDGKGGTTNQGFTITVTNTAPTVSVSSPSANMTLYENDLFYITGSAADVNANQSVTIYAQINFEQRIVLGIGLSNALVTFNKQLKFKGGQLYDGETAITGNLTDGVPHTLKIWAQDSDGGQSTIAERSFYVVPNRPPVLTIDTVQPSGIINTDKFAISGTASDPDDNDMTASYRLNGGNSVALEIIEGKWAFDITLAQLQVGQNTIVVELMDSYDFKVSKTIKLNKNEVKTPILQSVARYKIEPPKGSAKGVLLWIQRDEQLDLTVELSMTLQGEQEQYVTLTADHTAPVTAGIVEDEFYYEATEPKNNIILKLSTSHPDVHVDHKIHLISGVLE
ncbi:hypothetical protein I6G82_08280 [Lysinibacillus macroides]|uniref:BIG2 domain-containing protein n=1 Tax=Lysinibacillus macroides TaxID=33935 RepID=A0A0N0CVM4_9BACI|nr:hypothetical protein [Lysinibacillus macroides]KOY81587.1 hypothetical protein ADM90_14405 [Lysinibacillus macroides]QPR69569.1 hypothetical protein I6G82_08280 [Lysinibacillus macroides]